MRRDAWQQCGELQHGDQRRGAQLRERWEPCARPGGERLSGAQHLCVETRGEQVQHDARHDEQSRGGQEQRDGQARDELEHCGGQARDEQGLHDELDLNDESRLGDAQSCSARAQ